ncbi:MAG: HlyD family secretion protein [Roseiarcus sp.]
MSQATPYTARENAPSPAPPLPSAPAAARPAAGAPAAAPAPPASGGGRRRAPLRFLLLVLAPLAALALGLVWWLAGGRYVTTDNAYVGAEKVLITPQAAGVVAHVDVIEGQRVEIGDRLFEIDPAPYRIALALARGRLEGAKSEYQSLQVSYKADEDQIRMGEEAVKVRQADFDRKTALLAQRAGTAVDADTSAAALIQARELLAFVQQQQMTARINYAQARAQVDDAERNLANTTILAPIAGVATEVTQIQLGRFVAIGAPVFAIVADRGLWIDVNPKESDLTYVRTGLAATISVDAFPDRVWRGRVGAIAPGTGAQFAILPPQNASGNWVKVVQRVPLRVEFDPGEATAGLRAGMSAYVSIDTGRTRSLGALLADLSGGGGAKP